MKSRIAIIFINVLLFVNPLLIGQISTLKLVAFYPFNGNANDESGNNNNGIVNGATLTTDRFGNTNSAYFFNGIDNYIWAANTSLLQITGEISMCAWFKTGDAKEFAAIICKANPFEPRVGYLMDIDPLGLARADVIYDHSTNRMGSVVSTNNVVDDKWHFMVAEYDGSVLNLFIDGKLNAQKVYTGGMAINNEPLLIGEDENRWLSDRFFYGKIDEVMIYNRILNPSEILTLYNYNPGEINGNSEVCQGQKGVSYNAMGMDSILRYDWYYSGNGATITGSTDNILIDFSNDASSGYLKVIGSKICDCGKDSAIFEVTVNPIPLAIANSNSPVCSGNAIYLTPQIIPGGTYSWKGPNGFSSTAQNPVIIPATPSNEGVYTLTVSANACTSMPTSLTIDVYSCNSADLSVLTMVNDSLPVIGQAVVFTIIASNHGPFGAEGVKVSDILQAGYTFVSASTTSGTYDPSSGNWIIGSMNINSFQILTITAMVMPTGNYDNSAAIQGNEIEENMSNNISTTETYPLDFNIPNSFSPNGDGINDSFVIRGLKEDSKLIIFNRSGRKIYESENYQNDWEGKDDNGKILDSDTYWYILSLPENHSEFKGYVYIKN